MAKKKSKKNTTRLICSIVVIALAVLTICTLFMPVFTSTTKALGGAVQNDSHIKGYVWLVKFALNFIDKKVIDLLDIILDINMVFWDNIINLKLIYILLLKTIK